MHSRAEAVRKVGAEALGTALLLAGVVGSGIMGDMLANGNDAIALLGNTLATGAILVVLILVFGPISGAHFNPAVSLVFLLRKQIGAVTFVSYVIAQVAGAIAGAMLAHGMFDLPLIQDCGVVYHIRILVYRFDFVRESRGHAGAILHCDFLGHSNSRCSGLCAVSNSRRITRSCGRQLVRVAFA